MESGGVDAATIASQVITLCPIGDDLRVRTQLTKLRTQLHAAQIALHRMGNELTQATSHLEMERSARVRLERCMEELEYAGAGELDVRMSPRIIEGVRGKLNQLADRRIIELEKEVEEKVNEMKKVQACHGARGRRMGGGEGAPREWGQPAPLNKRLTQVGGSWRQPHPAQTETRGTLPTTHYSLSPLPSPYTHRSSM